MLRQLNLLSEFDLISLRDVLASPRSEVLEQAPLGHVLGHDLHRPVVQDDAQQTDQVVVLQSSEKIIQRIFIIFISKHKHFFNQFQLN